MPESTTKLPDIHPRDLLACDTPRLAVFTRDQLLFLGRDNLQHFRDTWKTMLRTSQSVLNTHEELLRLIEGKSPAELQALAAQYDNPNYPSQPSRYEGEDIAPADPTANSRAPDSTTFNICGWCKYAHCYLHPTSRTRLPHETRVFRPSCGLLSDKWQQEYEHAYNHPCPLTHSSLSNTYPAGICTNIHTRHNRLLAHHQQISEYIAHLNSLIAIAEPKPLFPSYRSDKHYAIGTPVYLIYNLYDGTGPSIIRGTVVGYNIRKYVTSAVRVTYSTDAPNTEPHDIQHDMARLLSFEELSYLLDHPDYAQIWLAACKHTESDVINIINFYHQHHCLPIA